MSRRLASVRDRKRREGVVVTMNFDKGFGRIASPPEEQEYFFHATDIQILDESAEERLYLQEKLQRKILRWLRGN